MTKRSTESASKIIEHSDALHYHYLVKSHRRETYQKMIEKSLINYPKENYYERAQLPTPELMEHPLPISGSFLILGDRQEDMHWFDSTTLNKEFMFMKAIGFDTLFVLTGVSDHRCHPSEVLPHQYQEDLLEQVLSAAEMQGIKVFIGVPNILIDWMIATPAELEEVICKTNYLASEIVARYNRFSSFFGWYLPYELCNVFIEESGEERMLPQWIGSLSKECRRAADKPVAIAPYFTTLCNLDRYRSLWEMVVKVVKPDILAMQDGVGIYGEDRLRELDAHFNILKEICCRTRVSLWADMEVFHQTSGIPIDRGTWKAVPADWGQIKTQILTLSCYVEKIVIFCFSSYMSPLYSQHAKELYRSYQVWSENE